MSGDLGERVALAILNSDRVAGGLPELASRDDVPDSEGYVRNARAVIPIVLEEVGRYLSACQYEPAPYTCLRQRLRTLSDGSAER